MSLELLAIGTVVLFVVALYAVALATDSAALVRVLRGVTVKDGDARLHVLGRDVDPRFLVGLIGLSATAYAAYTTLPA